MQDGARHAGTVVAALALMALACSMRAAAQDTCTEAIGIAKHISEREVLRTARDLQGMGSRIVGSAGNSNAAVYLHARLAGIPNLAVQYQDARWRNVVATLKGRDTNSTAVFVVGAHYDSAAREPSVAPGATDDAAGVALVLELARVLSTRQFRHTITFALWNGEESGQKGSSSYVAGALAGKDDIRLYMNLDSVCHDPKGALLLDIVHNKAATPAKDMMVTNSVRCGLGFTFEFNRHSCPGDHVAFDTNGIMTVAVHQQDHAYQHTPDDTVDKITPDYAVRIAQLYLTVLVPMAEPTAIMSEGGCGR